mmetsp:Transcript_49093/g.131379  ORF Transcript_49093/g.131379 Transcript_49093/m.131379 type:complete len:290 (+) Transcript_49093:1931-2800(+)
MLPVRHALPDVSQLLHEAFEARLQRVQVLVATHGGIPRQAPGLQALHRDESLRATHNGLRRLSNALQFCDRGGCLLERQLAIDKKGTFGGRNLPDALLGLQHLGLRLRNNALHHLLLCTRAHGSEGLLELLLDLFQTCLKLGKVILDDILRARLRLEELCDVLQQDLALVCRRLCCLHRIITSGAFAIERSDHLSDLLHRILGRCDLAIRLFNHVLGRQALLACGCQLSPLHYLRLCCADPCLELDQQGADLNCRIPALGLDLPLRDELPRLHDGCHCHAVRLVRLLRC